MLKNPEKGLFTVLFSSPPTSNTRTRLCNRANSIRFGTKILDIFVLETARVNGTDISESLRPAVTKKKYPPCKVEFLRFLTCIEPQEGKVNQTQFSLSLFSF